MAGQWWAQLRSLGGIYDEEFLGWLDLQGCTGREDLPVIKQSCGAMLKRLHALQEHAEIAIEKKRHLIRFGVGRERPYCVCCQKWGYAARTGSFFLDPCVAALEAPDVCQLKLKDELQHEETCWRGRVQKVSSLLRCM